MARIHNPHVVQVHDYGETQFGDPFLVMELVTGPTVSRWFRGAPQSLDGLLDAADGMLAGLAAAHARDILHRDLKPANMLLRGGVPSQLVLVDFGIAAVLSGADAEEALTREGTVLGTPLYMSPEQSLGQPARPESDVYAAGVVLFEWLSGRPPFSGSVVEVMRSHAFRLAPPLRPRAGLDVPEAVAAVVRQALEKAPYDRYPSAAAMRAALRTARGSRGPRARTLPSTQPLSRAEPVATVAVAPAPSQPFVGRHEELDRLRELVLGAAQGRGGVVFVEGLEGVGCTRLVDELVARLAESDEAQVGRGAIRGSAPLATLRQAVEDLLGSRTLGLDSLRHRLLSAGASLADEERGALLGWLRPEADEDGADLDGDSALVERFLRVLSRTRPVVLALDDFEREGARAVRWLESFTASQRLDPAPIWVIVTRSRAGDVTAEGPTVGSSILSAADVVYRVSVSRLGDAEIAALVGAEAPLTARAAGLIADKAAGMPLVALQLVRHLAAEERLIPVGARLGLPPDDDLRGVLPGGLQELWGHRLDGALRTSPDPELGARLLDVCAALGLDLEVDDALGGVALLDGAAPSDDLCDALLDHFVAMGLLLERGPVGTDSSAGCTQLCAMWL